MIVCNWGTHEFDDLRHLDLGEDTTSLVVTETGSIPDRERIWAFNRDFTRLAAVELGHTLNFGEGHEIAFLETVSCLIQTGNETFLILRWWFSISFVDKTI